MKKIIWKIWTLNLFLSIALYFAYRLFLIKIDNPEENWFETIISFFNFFLDIQFAITYIAVMIVCSFTFFLNLKENIRNNYALSLLTFVGIPFTAVLFFVCTLLSANNWKITKEITAPDFIIKIIGFSLVYLLLVLVEFFIFRKKIESRKS